MGKEIKGALITIAPLVLIIWLVVGYVVGYILAALVIFGAVILTVAVMWWIDFVFNHLI